MPSNEMCLLRLIGVKDLFCTKAKSLMIPKWIKEIYVHNKWQNLCKSECADCYNFACSFYILSLLFLRILLVPVLSIDSQEGPKVTSRSRAWDTFPPIIHRQMGWLSLVVPVSELLTLSAQGLHAVLEREVFNYPVTVKCLDKDWGRS